MVESKKTFLFIICEDIYPVVEYSIFIDKKYYEKCFVSEYELKCI